MKAIQEYTLLKSRTPSGGSADELAWLLVLDSMIFQAEAEIRWLDHCEARLARAARRVRLRLPERGSTGREHQEVQR